MLKKSVTKREYIRLKALGITGMIDSSIDPRVRDERLTFVNNINEVVRNKLKEYNAWYTGDSDELLNFYTRANSIDYNTDPLFNRNKKGYYWAVSSTETDIKRSHSGQPRNVVDTLVDIVGLPRIGVGQSVLEALNKRLEEILEENNFETLLLQEARPFTLVEGWGAFKINWDSEFLDVPILLYYRADAVDFVYKSGHLIAIIYADYYQDEKGRNYVLYETRRTEKRTIDGVKVPCLIIEKDLFKISGDSEVLTPVELKSLPQLKDTNEAIIVKNYSGFLGYPCIIYKDNNDDTYGRSIFTGKLDLFDDLDQCLSQAANTVRRSTTQEYFNSLYLEKDQNTGMPIMPKNYDRKYTMFQGGKGGDGPLGNGFPVQVSQPQLNFVQYDQEAQSILLQIIAGIMSPATLGIDVAKADRSGEAQREKEKVTIFTRNVIMSEEGRMLRKIANELLVADELMHKGEVTCTKYDVFVKYDEFADASFEAKLETVLAGWQSGIMSDELAMEYLHKDSSASLKERELKFLKAQRAKEEQQSGMLGGLEDSLGDFGDMGADNAYNESRARPTADGVKEDLGVPELDNYEKLHNRSLSTDVEKEVLDEQG